MLKKFENRSIFHEVKVYRNVPFLDHHVVSVMVWPAQRIFLANMQFPTQSNPNQPDRRGLQHQASAERKKWKQVVQRQKKSRSVVGFRLDNTQPDRTCQQWSCDMLFADAPATLLLLISDTLRAGPKRWLLYIEL